jgi:Bacterial capsule synthesis protein PGA_cap
VLCVYHGPQVGGPKTIIDDLKAMGIQVITTAINHTMDHYSQSQLPPAVEQARRALDG